MGCLRLQVCEWTGRSGTQWRLGDFIARQINKFFSFQMALRGGGPHSKRLYKVINRYSELVLEISTLKIAHFFNESSFSKDSLHCVSYDFQTVFYWIHYIFWRKVQSLVPLATFLQTVSCFMKTKIMPLVNLGKYSFTVSHKFWVLIIFVYFRNWIHYRGKCYHCWRNILSLESPLFIFCMPYFMNIRIILLVDPGKYNLYGK